MNPVCLIMDVSLLPSTTQAKRLESLKEMTIFSSLPSFTV